MVHALKQIDMASIVFFIGILLAVATLEHTLVLEMLANGSISMSVVKMRSSSCSVS